MPITFKTKHSPNILMLDSVGLQMLKMMGTSATVPSALSAEDVADALESLRRHINQQSRPAADQDESERDDERHVSLAHRALPLIDLLEAALQHGDHVIWDR